MAHGVVRVSEITFLLLLFCWTQTLDRLNPTVDGDVDQARHVYYVILLLLLRLENVPTRYSCGGRGVWLKVDF